MNLQQQLSLRTLTPHNSHATRTCIHICTGVRQTGHSFIRDEQSPHAHWWPHGPAACDLGLVKQIMHVNWPPMVDSGASSRPVLNCASASDVTAGGGGGGGLFSHTGAAAAKSAAAPASDEPAGTCRLDWPSR
eukprot:scaffold32784_cov69-Phaeocystis_antarctica.AAC.10